MNTQTQVKAPAIHETITPDGEIVTTYQGMEVAMAAGLSAAEIDAQVGIARKYPRRIEKIIADIRAMATIDEETAEACMYSVPRAGKAIEGPSIRFAEIAQSCWGNNRTGARVVMVDRAEKFVEAEGVFHDLENNSLTLARCRVRLVDRNGKLYNEDMILVASAGAQARAKRNAILGGVPKPITNAGYQAARAVAMGDASALANRRADILKAFQRFGVTADQILAALHIKKIEDINAEGVLSLRGAFTALKSNELTVEEWLGPVAGTTKPPEEKPTRKTAEKKESPVEKKSADEATTAKAAETTTEETKPKAISLDDAEAMGFEGHGKGKALRAVPGEWRDDDKWVAHIDRWQIGWRKADVQKK